MTSAKKSVACRREVMVQRGQRTLMAVFRGLAVQEEIHAFDALSAID